MNALRDVLRDETIARPKLNTRPQKIAPPLGLLSGADELRAALRCGSPRCECARGPRRTHCPSPGHPDRRPSLDIDERGGKTLFICRSGCRQQEVIEGLRHRGLWSSAAPARKSARSSESPLDEARRTVRLEALRQLRRLPLEQYRWADELRWCYQLVGRARAMATRLGESETVWNLLLKAARLETATLAAEAEA